MSKMTDTFAWAPCEDSDWLLVARAAGLPLIREERIEVAGRSMLTCAIAEIAESERPVTIVTQDGSLSHPDFGKIDTSETVSVISWASYKRRAARTRRYGHDRRDAMRIGRREASLKGRRGGVTPFGYRTDVNGQLGVDEKSAPAVFCIFAAYASGVPVPEILGKLKSLFPKRRWSRQAMHHILRNPIYCGEIRAAGSTVQFEGLRIVPDDLFNRCRALSAERRLHRMLARDAAPEPEPQSHAG